MSITPRSPLSYSVLTDTDSYKLSHWNQYPPGTTRMMSYFESRGGEFETCTLFGLQYLLHEYLSRTVTLRQVREAAAFAAAHGEPFNEAGWTRVATTLGGRLPVRIRAIPEGTVVPTRNAVLTLESTDPETFWVVSWLETMLVRLWYPSTIATASREAKKLLHRYLQLSADDPAAELPFKLHDFGARGVTCLEQSRLGGAAWGRAPVARPSAYARRLSRRLGPSLASHAAWNPGHDPGRPPARRLCPRPWTV